MISIRIKVCVFFWSSFWSSFSHRSCLGTGVSACDYFIVLFSMTARLLGEDTWDASLLVNYAKIGLLSVPRSQKPLGYQCIIPARRLKLTTRFSRYPLDVFHGAFSPIKTQPGDITRPTWQGDWKTFGPLDELIGRRGRGEFSTVLYPTSPTTVIGLSGLQKDKQYTHSQKVYCEAIR